MANGSNKSQWQRTAPLMALIANANRDPKKQRKPYVPEDFDPYASRKAKAKPPRAPITILKMFVREP